jgi:hypothetical protein
MMLLPLPALGAGEPASQPAAEKQTQYYAVLLGGKKVGHAIHARAVADGKVTTTDTVVVTIRRLDVALTVQQTETTVETAEGKPLSFRSVQDMGIMATEVEGAVDAQGKVSATVTTGGAKQQRTLDWPEGALMSEGIRLLEHSKGLKEGTTYAYKTFMPSMLAALATEVCVGPTAQADLFGRVVRLTEVTSTVTMPTGAMTGKSYVDQDFQTLRMVSPMIGMTLEMVSCSRQVALAKEDVVDFFDKLLLPSPAVLEKVGSARALRYVMQPTGNVELHFPATDDQTVQAGEDGRVIVTVRPVAPPKGTTFPYAGADQKALAATRPARFLQSDSKEIGDLARQAVGDTADAAEAAGRIEKFVRQYIQKKDLSVGYASAAEVASARQGDCTEHAVLTAAMCRAVGIPARVVCGLAYVDKFGQRRHVFGPHAWTQARLGDRWVGLDSALDGYDAAHIALAIGDGSPEDFFGIVSMLGYFTIARIEVENQKP